MLPTQVELKALLDYDPNTGILIWKYRPRNLFKSNRAYSTWNSRYAGKQAFTAIDKKGYNTGAINNVNYRAPRIIYKWFYGIEPVQVDHEDGNTQNNRIRNLRNVTGLENQKNMKKASNNKSGTTGISWNAGKNCWEAKIQVNKKVILLGRSKDINILIPIRKAAEAKYNFHKNHGR